jgi:hypothetical protein
LTGRNKRCHKSAASEARALGDIMSESMGGIISECPGDFIGIRKEIAISFQEPQPDIVDQRLLASAQTAARRPACADFQMVAGV